MIGYTAPKRLLLLVVNISQAAGGSGAGDYADVGRRIGVDGERGGVSTVYRESLLARCGKARRGEVEGDVARSCGSKAPPGCS